MESTVQQYVQAHKEELYELLKTLCAIPAPSHHEEKRAAFCKEWLEAAGAAGVYIDEAKNTVFPLGCTDSREITAIFAHTDTVFPDTEPMPFEDRKETLHCPGIGDDTANLVMLLLTAKFMLEQKITPKGGILFVCNSCEEGLGNLKGVRQIFRDYAGRIKQFVSFDGFYCDLADRCVGSHRYEIEATTAGGHSYGDFGNENAIRVLASIVEAIYKIQVPKIGNSKTTYNVGSIEGGTSVNTIAQSAKMLCEYRSDNEDCLAQMETSFAKIFADAQSERACVKVTRIGERPCMGKVDLKKIEQMASVIEELAGKITHVPVNRVSMSTDCNVPLSLGIPAVCIGLYAGGGMHTREEWLSKASLAPGLEFGIRITLALTEKQN